MKINKQDFFTAFRPFYKEITGKRQLSEAVVSAVDFLLDEFSASSDWSNGKLISYGLATIAHETAWTFRPIKEYRAKEGTNARRKQDAYWSTGYYGRGFVQLTHKSNYEKAGRKLGVDLVHYPNRALDQDLAFKIFTQGMFEGWFTGKKITDYINDHSANYLSARRVINGTDRASLIASYARSFEAILEHSMSGKDLVETISDVKEVGDEQLPDNLGSEENNQPTNGTNSDPVDNYPEEPKPGEPTPDSTAKPGEPVVGGRPGDEPKPVEEVKPTETSGWGAWVANVRAQLAALGLGSISLGSLTFLSNPLFIKIALGLVAVAIIVSFTVFVTTMIIKHREKMKREEQAYQLTLEQLKLGADPTKYNVEVIKREK